MSTKYLFAAVVVIAASALLTGIVMNWPQEQPQPKAVAIESTEPPSLVSQLRPGFTFPDVSGKQRNVMEWNGKVLVINFWGTWCGPCKEEIPAFNTLQQQYRAKGVQFIGVALDDRETVQDYLETNAMDYPVLVDGEDAAMQLAIRYGNDQAVVPYTAFIDRQGRIAFLQYGAMSQDLAREILESLL